MGEEGEIVMIVEFGEEENVKEIVKKERRVMVKIRWGLGLMRT